MSSVNKVILVGRLGQDPETRDVNGTMVANFSIATSETWKDKSSGEKKEKTEWHRVVAWGRQAEVAGEYLTKGSLVFVEGQLQTRSYRVEGEEKDRYTTEIRISNMRMLGGRSNGNSGDNNTSSKPEPMAVGAAPAGSDEKDNIPF